jgi:sterol desaturase/sphingolipid hydroxylase (fatty acid hydroxylase superfamily)
LGLLPVFLTWAKSYPLTPMASAFLGECLDSAIYFQKAVRVFCVYIPLSAAAILWNVRVPTHSWWTWIVAPGAGLATWTLLEYLIHRFVFHRLAPHQRHHERPADRQYWFAPLWLSLLFAAALLVLFAVGTGSWPLAALAESGAVAGYLGYELLHVWIHSQRNGGAMLVALRKHHYYHHFVDDTRCYGVVTPFWDRVFGSLPR